MSTDHSSKEKRYTAERYATDWASAEIRMHREGNLYQLEIASPGEGKGRFVTLEENVALALEDLWLT